MDDNFLLIQEVHASLEIRAGAFSQREDIIACGTMLKVGRSGDMFPQEIFNLLPLRLLLVAYGIYTSKKLRHYNVSYITIRVITSNFHGEGGGIAGHPPSVLILISV